MLQRRLPGKYVVTFFLTNSTLSWHRIGEMRGETVNRGKLNRQGMLTAVTGRNSTGLSGLTRGMVTPVT